MPDCALLIRLYLKPIIVILFVSFHVCDDGLEFFLESVLPLFVFGAGMDREQGDLVSRLLQRIHHSYFKSHEHGCLKESINIKSYAYKIYYTVTADPFHLRTNRHSAFIMPKVGHTENFGNNHQTHRESGMQQQSFRRATSSVEDTRPHQTAINGSQIKRDEELECFQLTGWEQTNVLIQKSENLLNPKALAKLNRSKTFKESRACNLAKKRQKNNENCVEDPVRATQQKTEKNMPRTFDSDPDCNTVEKNFKRQLEGMEENRQNCTTVLRQQQTPNQQINHPIKHLSNVEAIDSRYSGSYPSHIQILKSHAKNLDSVDFCRSKNINQLENQKTGEMLCPEKRKKIIMVGLMQGPKNIPELIVQGLPTKAAMYSRQLKTEASHFYTVCNQIQDAATQKVRKPRRQIRSATHKKRSQKHIDRDTNNNMINSKSFCETLSVTAKMTDQNFYPIRFSGRRSDDRIERNCIKKAIKAPFQKYFLCKKKELIGNKGEGSGANQPKNRNPETLSNIQISRVQGRKLKRIFQ